MFGSAAAVWPLAVGAQPAAKFKNIGVFVPGSLETHGQYLKEFRNALGDLGYQEGANYALNISWGEGAFDRFRNDAAQLIGAGPDVILATGTAVLSAIKQETQTVPVVFVQIADPVASGFVENLAHPGGNLTGFTNFEPAMTGKWLELLKQIAPNITQAALVYNPQATAAAKADFLQVFEMAAGSLSVRPIDAPFHVPGELNVVIAEFERQKNGGMVVMPDGSTIVNLKALLDLASSHHVPAVYPFREFAIRGGLVSYGADVSDQYRQAAVYIDRILKGEKPADLAVQTPTKFEMVINIKTAKALGLAVPPNLLVLANEVIE